MKEQDKSSNKVESIFTGDKRESGKFILVLSAIVFAIIAALTAYVVFSSRRTEDTVHKVSEYYLEEMSSNVNQVFTTHFDGYYKELKLALLATSAAKLQSAAELQAHLDSMAERGNFLFYALIDEDGRVYINDEAYLSDFLRDFLQNTEFDGEEVTIEKLEESENRIIIAMPVEDLTINGKKIIAGAKGIADSKVRTEILLRTNDSDTYAHMITPDGTYIVAGDNRELVKSDNYFTDLVAAAAFAEDYSIEKMVLEIQQQRNGSVDYYVNGVRYYGYYRLLPRSGWYVVITLPSGTINDIVSETALTVVRSSIVLMVAILSVVLTVFYIYYKQREKSAVLNLQKLEAEERNRAKSSFLSSMSHDIRTPMNAIIGFTNLAIQQENNERVQDYLNKIRTSSNHLLSLINDVLDMSRIESGKMHIEDARCNLADIFHGLHTIIQGQVQSKQQNLYMDVINVVDENIWCDKMRLNQVLINLLSNAVKFTPAGGTISVIVRQKDCARQGYGAYEFRVKDTGIGMTEEFSKKVFEPFERERSATVNGIQGTGLGMSIVKNIVDMMGGTIEVETELNKGTEFIVNLELKLQDDIVQIEDASDDLLKGMRAMVVDDDFSSCDGVIKMLHKLGMDAEWTMSGREAVLRNRQSIELGQSYQVFIIDWQLPDLNGLEVIRQIRTSIGKEVPILLMSSYSWDDVEAEAIAAGVTKFCSKPVFMSELRTKLLEMFLHTESEEQQANEEEETADQFLGKRILLVEDNELNREIANEILQEYGFEIEDAENGKIALEKVENSEPGYYGLVLMDVQMPVMNGYEASRAIRKLANPELAKIPILAMTANAFEEDKQNSLAAGMNGHITKPIDIDSLLETLRQII